MKIIFMGTPQFSCVTLQKLLDDKEFEIVAVYTREAQLAGRGQKLMNSPVHDLALKYGLKVITPKTLRNAEIQKEFAELKADATVVVAYGLILPKEILQAPKFGCINIHPSLLPRWRGPAPIQFSLLNDVEEIGVTIIKMDEGIDSGDILAQEKFDIDKTANYTIWAEKLAIAGAEILIETLKKLPKNEIVPVVQNHAAATFSKKLDKKDCLIDFNLSAVEIERKIRALSGSLTAYFELKGEKIKIYSAQIIEKNSAKKPGEIVDENFSIQCKEGQIRPLILQRQGKKVIGIDEFLRGFRFDSIN